MKGFAIQRCNATIAILIIIGLTDFSCTTSSTQMRLDAEGAVQDLRQVRSGEQEFKSRNGRWGTLKELVDLGVVDKELSDGAKGPYLFTLELKGTAFEAHVYPSNKEGKAYSFYLDDTGIIRVRPYGSDIGYELADKTDQVAQGN